MKRPLTLLVGIVISIMALSIIFPSDPQKPDLISIIKNSSKKEDKPVQAKSNYSISNLLRVDSSGSALSWSLDEKYLYYKKEVTQEGNKSLDEIWVSDLEGNKRKISSIHKFYNIRDAKWSPDGTMFSFISDSHDNKSRLFIYDSVHKTFTDITPEIISDLGVTSYDWDDQSASVIMSVDILNPSIGIYNIENKDYSKLDMKLNSHGEVAFYKDGGIIFSDKDEESKYSIYAADISGKNIRLIVGGQSFIISPDRQKLAILKDAHLQSGLWFYNTTNKNMKMLSTWPVYNLYWLSNSNNFIFSMEEDCKKKQAFKGSINFLNDDLKIVDIMGAVHSIFVSSRSGERIAITSPETIEGGEENKGIFIGQLNR